jgi:tRNA synthetases class II (D, K and N)
MDYGEAIGVLERANQKFEFSVQCGVDLQSERERYLTEQYAKKPVVVMNYPNAIKALYIRVNDDGRTVAAMDVLAPGIGEIIGGSQPEERPIEAGLAGLRRVKRVAGGGLSQGRSTTAWESSCDNARHRGSGADTRQPPRGLQ